MNLKGDKYHGMKGITRLENAVPFTWNPGHSYSVKHSLSIYNFFHPNSLFSLHMVGASDPSFHEFQLWTEMTDRHNGIYTTFYRCI